MIQIIDNLIVSNIKRKKENVLNGRRCPKNTRECRRDVRNPNSYRLKVEVHDKNNRILNIKCLPVLVIVLLGPARWKLMLDKSSTIAANRGTEEGSFLVTECLTHAIISDHK